MSTRALVGLQNEFGGVEYIYNHFDGYIAGGLGEYLRENVTTEDQLKDILSQGDASSIQNGIYYAARGEDVPSITVAGPGEFVDSGDGIDYLYLMVNGEWMFRNYRMNEWEAL